MKNSLITFVYICFLFILFTCKDYRQEKVESDQQQPRSPKQDKEGNSPTLRN